MPRFLDLAFTFGKTVAGTDFHYTAFNAENFLDASDAKKHCIPRLGRSGREIRHCFNLWSVEKSDTTPYYWPIRQTAVYHSFDVCTGRNVWINIKGNELMQNRITQALASKREPRPSSLNTVSGSFSASLQTHLVVMEWCSENWRTMVDELESQLSDILKKAENHPSEEFEDLSSLDPDIFLRILTNTEASARRLPHLTDSTVHAKLPPRTDTVHSVRSSITPKRILSGFSKASTGQDTGRHNPPELCGPKTPLESLKPPLNSPALQKTLFTYGTVQQAEPSVLREFHVDGLQQLTTVASKLHELKLVMELNVQVINQIMDSYQTLAESDGMPLEVRKDCAEDLNAFLRRARAVRRDLEMELSRSETLLWIAEDKKSLVSVVQASLHG